MRIQGLTGLATLLLANSACSAAPGNAPAAVANQPFRSEVVADFEAPWAMTFLPGSGRPLTSQALVTEKAGKLWLVDVASGQRQEVMGVPTNIRVEGQGGLGDVVVAPDFAGSQRVYLSYVEPEGELSGAVVGTGRLILGQEAPRLEDFRVIWRQQPKVTGGGHFSHRIAFGPDGKLYISSGERQKFDPAQDPNANLGRIVRLNADGTVPGDNPWSSRGGVGAQAWTMGNRNVLGLAFGPDGRLWGAEMGPAGGDELNHLERGSNYGYPIVSDGDHYDGRVIPDHSTRPEFNGPEIVWTPVISPSSMIFYSGDDFPAWRGNALIGGLSAQGIVRVAIDGNTAREVERLPMSARIREVEQGPDGELYVLEDERDGSQGRLLRLTPGAQTRR
ncbi:PQQ-dependent sugar dehydrogenase [Sphingomonas arenae]|uniref:PQQ-dependent sugar dehydrogenase n=1 Tax=Sphingomonas arenae TaxID=2812555 RepID=UPI001967EC0F|nr:PQQ-dependent sugar dehydrogenase [Sphingomonas arenae]